MKISVYITSYNQKYFLKEAIDSVLNQTFNPYEIIIVDDCSTDGSQELILKYSNSYPEIKPIFHQVNKGVAEVRISALKAVRGDYVTYLDGDDLYLPNKLQIESDIIKNEKCDLAFSNNMYVDEKNTNHVKWLWACKPISVKISKTNFFIKTISRDFPRNSLFRMELVNYNLLKQVGFHDANLKIYEDYDLRIRLAQICSVGFSLEPTAKIRISEKGLSKSSLDKHKIAFEYILKKYSNDINSLDLKSRIYIKEILNDYILKFSDIPSKLSSTPTFKERIKNKLISIINKI
jgi:glycosyltransferase involved in cell wall biosynthesis